MLRVSNALAAELYLRASLVLTGITTSPAKDHQTSRMTGYRPMMVAYAGKPLYQERRVGEA